MAVDRKLFSELRKLDRHDLRRVLIFVRGLLLSMGDDFGGEAPGAVTRAEAGVTYRLESVRCGKPGCTSCPHGPYWYAYFREGKQLRSRYIGRDLPPDVKAIVGSSERD
ncbi:MAG TPA: hypothetical protein VJ927_08900 [Actinomycetota bacterium]|nr:hypothetical protein [Actinomycetota bacterium]